ncbi:DUF2974 domain-containing protein [Geomonas oryzisoli]|uniref:DUF2974 domain-containing protein n=1 Tax=Geomonas oryzisoli TaxID=2847992 RepID=A0ABX8J4G0_9BACT|nr:DUF2974 domain-containing protein [Geomonas oryzisoli]QWV91991.1 DUF2974 domain-containing protein [Geomonas oryzisoli]
MLDGLFDRIGSAARNGSDYAGMVAKAAGEKVAHTLSEAKSRAAKQLFAKPAGAAIEPCPKNKKAERVAERKAKLAAGKERLQAMPPGRQRDALAQATERFERNNVAVERARLAEDAYKVGQGEPPEGWERVSATDLKKLGMTKELFPQLRKTFRASEYRDGYYPELSKSKASIFGEERYVLAFRGTQGIKDGAADVIQAFGGETDQYSRAVRTAQKLKRVLGSRLDITGHSMGGGMATLAGIVTDSPVWAIDPAGVHPATLERVGVRYSNEVANKRINNYVAEGEILDCIQQPAVQRTAMAGLMFTTPVGGVALTTVGRRAVFEEGVLTYGARGPIHRIKILSNAKEISSNNQEQGVYPGLAERLNNRLNPIQKIELHDVTYVIAGIEQQKADDLQVMER